MIKVRCRTNLDDYKREDWPEVMCCRPLIGDSVKSKLGRELRVVDITHSFIWQSLTSPDPISPIRLRPVPEKCEPYLIVELHKERPL